MLPGAKQPKMSTVWVKPINEILIPWLLLFVPLLDADAKAGDVVTQPSIVLCGEFWKS